MRRYVFRLAIVTLAVLGSSTVRADDQQDQQIAQQIMTRYQAAKQDGSLKGFSIDLSVEQGSVWLSGRVASEEQQAKALDIARRIPGVKQVVNDLQVSAGKASPASATQKFASSVSKYFGGRGSEPSDERAIMQQVSNDEGGAIGSGLDPSARRSGVVQAAPQAMSGYGGGGGVPLAMAPARSINYQGGVVTPEGIPGAPVPMHMPGSGVGIAPARYDHPSMPGYAWPSYAAYPNYAAVTYPKQYSASAWPYIGPFYPYPQVPLGWRKVTLEWDDGWWFLDFKDRRTPYNH
jgi:hypothetical protein